MREKMQGRVKALIRLWGRCGESPTMSFEPHLQAPQACVLPSYITAATAHQKKL